MEIMENGEKYDLSLFGWRGEKIKENRVYRISIWVHNFFVIIPNWKENKRK